MQSEGKYHFKELVAALALLAASTAPTLAQSNWTGTISTDWFTAGNWSAGVPTAVNSPIIDTVTPNATVLGTTGGAAQNLTVGQSRTGMLTIQGGGTLTNVSGAVGNGPGSQGAVTVSGPGSTWTNTGTIQIGGLGLGTLTIQNGGTVNSAGGGSVGLSAGSTGAVIVTGLGSVWNNTPGGGLNVGSFGTGMLTIANGGVVNNNTAFIANIGSGAGSQGTVIVTGAGSIWTNSSGLNVGASGTGTLTVSDSGIVIGPITVARDAGSVGTLNIGGSPGDPPVAPGTLNTATVAFGSGTGVLSFNHSSANYVFAPAVSGNGTVNVLAGTTILTAANTYTGVTTIGGGTLAAGAVNTFSAASHTVVESGGTLALRGFNQTLNNGLENAGTVQLGIPGVTPPGTTLTVAGNYVGHGGTLALNTFLSGDASPTDRLIINGGSADPSLVRITHMGGGGDYTTNGIPVVVVTNGGTTTPNAFSLANGELRAGFFDYRLFRGGLDGSRPDDWFLRSAFLGNGGGGGGGISPPGCRQCTSGSARTARQRVVTPGSHGDCWQVGLNHAISGPAARVVAAGF
jgi:T5SS/PEP-CTERM-associated repeat protein